jgi:aspartate-semialdehyde dehydrogenase
MAEYVVAVAGATGAVGREMIRTLEQRNFPVRKLKLLASERSKGLELEYKGERIQVEVLQRGCFDGVDIALFSCGGGRSLDFAPDAAASGAVVIDNSSAWRMDPDVPLVVPEVNPHAVADYKKKGIIANPNCSTIQMVVPLKPIHDYAKVRRVIVATYQATSGAGKKAMDELMDQTRAVINFKPVECGVFPHQIAFDCLPHIDVFQDNGYTKEEMKMFNETRKIMEDEGILVSATTVRVPVFVGHSESVTVETEREITPDKAREVLSAFPGVVVQDDPSQNVYPLAIEAAGKDEVFVGRIRRDLAFEHGLSMWVVADNLRKGAALNAVQIGEVLIGEYM